MGRRVKKIELPYVWSTKNARKPGQFYYYYRRAKLRIPLPQPDHPDFLARYNTIHASFKVEGKRVVAPRSMKELIMRYRESAAYLDLAEESKKTYETVLKPLEAAQGDKFVSEYRRKHKISAELRQQP